MPPFAKTSLLILAVIVTFSFHSIVAFSMSSETASGLEETSDRLNRWLNRWEEHKLGWQRAEVNHGLLKYGMVKDDSCPVGGMRWFVPLCGKTVDMAYLASQETTAEVVGIDGIQKALDEFAKEHPDLQVQPNGTVAEGQFTKMTGKKISLLKGDYFAITPEVTGDKFDAVQDRASMVAIDPSLREDYVKIIGQLLKPGGKILLNTIERRTGEEEALKKGPPFPIIEAEVRRLYEGLDRVKSITLLEEINEFERSPEDKDRFEGVTSMYERYFLTFSSKPRHSVAACYQIKMCHHNHNIDSTSFLLNYS